MRQRSAQTQRDTRPRKTTQLEEYNLGASTLHKMGRGRKDAVGKTRKVDIFVCKRCGLRGCPESCYDYTPPPRVNQVDPYLLVFAYTLTDQQLVSLIPS